jgi:hypothetical protein
VYFVKPSASALDPATPTPQNGIGNVHLALHLSFERGPVTFSPSVTGTAPTGDPNKGLSTGHATWDASNRLELSAGRLTPYAELGLANTISDTAFFTRPFTSFGLVGHFEGGTEVRLTRRLGLVASAYAIAPSGTQTIVSRVLPPGLSKAPGQQNNGGRGRGRKQGVFELAPRTVGPAEIARDRGFSAGITVAPAPNVDFAISYSHSVTYALDTISFGIGLNPGALVRHRP